MNLLNCFVIFVLFLNFKNKNVLIKELQIDFINVGQGDSTLIVTPNNKVILIDVGVENDKKEYEQISNFLLNKGLSRINYIFVSHNDSDHNGALPSLKEGFAIDNIVEGNFNELIIDDIKFSQINKMNYTNENDNSQIITFKYKDKRFLFLGDVSKEVEQSIVLKEKELELVKIAHHGSNTSTSDYLVSNYKINNAIISVGKNYYGHPHKEVIDKLKCNIYTTLDNGTITYTSSVLGNKLTTLR